MTKVRIPFYKSKIFRLSLFTLLTFVIFGYLAVTIFGANGFTSPPTRALGSDTPATYGLNYENISFQTTYKDNITLKGWWIPRKDSDKVLIFLHPKDGTRLALLPLAKPLWERGYNLLLFDMRSHGESGGEHYYFGAREQWDTVGAVNFVKGKGFAPGKIGAIGWSMGAATTIMAMSQTQDIKAAVVDSAYADFASLADRQFTTATRLPKFLLGGILVAGRILYDVDVDAAKPVDAIKNLGNRHLFLIHGTADTLVPVSDTEKLIAAGGSNITEKWLVEGAVLVGAYELQPESYINRVVAFFDRELN
jgi:dienelactone hydrolase